MVCVPVIFHEILFTRIICAPVHLSEAASLRSKLRVLCTELPILCSVSEFEIWMCCRCEIPMFQTLSERGLFNCLTTSKYLESTALVSFCITDYCNCTQFCCSRDSSIYHSRHSSDVYALAFHIHIYVVGWLQRFIFMLFRSTSKSRPNNIRGGKCPSVRPYVRPSVHKKFLRFEWNLVCR